MGINNYQGNFKLSNCIACNSNRIDNRAGNYERDSYDYKCNASCQKTIVISDLVLSSNFIKEIKENKTYQNELHQDILHWKEDEYIITSEEAQFFLNQTYKEQHPIKNFDAWNSGEIPGYPDRYEHISSEDLEKINQKQIELYKVKVNELTEKFVNRFKKKLEKSSNPSVLVQMEIDGIKKILSDSTLERHEKNEFGTLYFSTSFTKKIRKHYKDLVTGRANYNCIIHPAIKKLIGSQWQEEAALVDASTFPKYLTYLESLTSKNEESEDYEEDINEKIDEILKKIIRLEHGQEIIFDEVNSLKEYSKKLPRKEFKQLVLGKLFDLGSKKLVDSNFAKEIMTTLFGDDFNKLLGNI